ncbi:hypothetical protein E1A91_A04G137800v1 [Gossypium mustelinum]|uniref:B box-type domain-containing protein n=8 Tax=Gossypium TaxID=3633 RepID=A0A5D2ZNQ0_GOSMU|nr:hypothetical protein E1A91_A04G137800v1 [Gossypium mustelinum]
MYWSTLRHINNFPQSNTLVIYPLFSPKLIAHFSHSNFLHHPPTMCKGLQQGSTSSSCLKQGVSLSPNANPRVSTRLVKCELCNSRATLYCQADDAYLCRKCDKWVHDANFLAQRHIRCFLCNTCQNLTQRYLIGASHEVLLPTMVSWSERRHCNSDMETEHSTTLKIPFLFL